MIAVDQLRRDIATEWTGRLLAGRRVLRLLTAAEWEGLLAEWRDTALNRDFSNRTLDAAPIHILFARFGVPTFGPHFDALPEWDLQQELMHWLRERGYHAAPGWLNSWHLLPLE